MPNETKAYLPIINIKLVGLGINNKRVFHSVQPEQREIQSKVLMRARAKQSGYKSQEPL
jgi:hypothetical protein